jgi:parallel beta-helix repeat protein
VFGNNIASNRCGINLSDCSDNRIFHNNFLENTEQAASNSSANVWDDGYPSGGNYWSDYDGTDADHDGIGDTPYVIDVNNTDSCPLMGMFHSFNVSWVDSGYFVDLISNSTISRFDVGVWIEHPEDPNTRIIGFNVTGEDDTIGFCRILIPTALMNGTYTVFVNRLEIVSNLLPGSNSTHRYLYFNYTHSTQEVTIIPEFPSFLILPLFFIATLLAVIVYRRKHF